MDALVGAMTCDADVEKQMLEKALAGVRSRLDSVLEGREQLVEESGEEVEEKPVSTVLMRLLSKDCRKYENIVDVSRLLANRNMRQTLAPTKDD